MCYSCGCNCGCNYDCGCSDNPCTNCATTTTTTFHCDDPSSDVVVNSDCVIYTGPSNPCYGILSGYTGTDIIAQLLLQSANCTPPVPTTTTSTTTTSTTSTSTTSTSTTSTTTTAAPINCYKLINTFPNTSVSVSYITEAGGSGTIPISGGGTAYKCGISVTPTLGVIISNLGLCSDDCVAPTTTTTTSTTTSTTSTTTTSTTSTTSTSTTTTSCSDPQCSQVVLSGLNKVYSYNFCKNELIETTVPGFTSAVNHGVAVNTQFMWSSRTPKFTEWIITYSPFVAVSSRDILFPTGFNQTGTLPFGIVAKNNTGYKVIGWNSKTSYFSELDLSGSTATFIDMFDFGTLSDRSAVGNPLYTTSDKLITINNYKDFSSYYLTQFNYSTGAVEIDINITDSLYNPVGLMMPTCNCACSLYVIYLKKDGSGSRLIKKINLSTGAITLITQSIGSSVDVSCGAAQLPSCSNCDMGLIPTTTTSTTSTSTTTTSTTSTSTTTTSTTASPIYIYYANVYDCTLPAPLNCISTNVTKVTAETPGNTLTTGAFYTEGTAGPALGLIYEIQGLTSGPANTSVSDLTSYLSCEDACGASEGPPPA
jgi:hypothetical protein